MLNREVRQRKSTCAADAFRASGPATVSRTTPMTLPILHKTLRYLRTNLTRRITAAITPPTHASGRETTTGSLSSML